MEKCGGDFQDHLSISKIKINLSENDFLFRILDWESKFGVEIVLNHIILQK